MLVIFSLYLKAVAGARWQCGRAFSLKQTFAGACKDKNRGDFIQVAEG